MPDTKPYSASGRWRKPLDPRFDQPAERNCSSMSDIGDVLRTRRREQGWTQSDMAAACGFSQRLIGEIERGRGSVGIDKVIRYANWLGVDIVTRVRGKLR